MNLLCPLLSNKSSPQAKRPFAALRMVGRFLAWATLWTAVSSQAQDFTFSTFAGVSDTPGSTNGNGSALGKPLFNNPSGLALDNAGFAYVSDTNNGTIRKVNIATGQVTTFAGTSGLSGNIDGTGGAARFSSPEGSAIDSAGNIYIADYSANSIRKITNAGVATTLAGSVTGSSGSSDGTGSAALFFRPSAVAVDGSGNVYVADTNNNLIRKVTSAGVVTTFAGSPLLAFGSADGIGSAATFRTPEGVAVDSAGNVFVADTGNNTIRMIVATTGAVSTIAGAVNTFGSTDAAGSAARFDFPDSLAIDAAGNIYVTDGANSTIRKITRVTSGGATTWQVSTLAGTPGQSGFADGTGAAALFNHPSGIAVDSSGNVYVADYGNHLVRKITATGVVTTLAGVPGTPGSLDGTGTATTSASLFFGPSATATDTAGNVYVADTNNQLIRKITPAGVATTLAGNPRFVGSTDGTGISASFYNPSGIFVKSDGTIYVADTGNHTIRNITQAGVVTTMSGVAGYAGVALTLATTYTVVSVPPVAPSTVATSNLDTTIVTTITTTNPTAVTTSTTTEAPVAYNTGDPIPANTTQNSSIFNSPSSVVVDGSGITYVADYNNHYIRAIAADKTVTIFAGTGSPGFADGVGALASFNHPRALATDGVNLYVADLGNQVIRKISLATGAVSTIAGTAGVAGSANGTGAAAQFNGPSGIAVDTSTGILYVADTNNNTIRAVSTSGAVTTVAGSAGTTGNADGTGNAVRFDQPTGISVYHDATVGAILYVADYRNNTIRKGVLTGAGPGTAPLPPTGSTPTGNGKISHPEGIAADSSGNIYIADTANNSIKKVVIGSDGSGTVTIFAGRDGTAGSTDGTGTAALFNGPTALVTDNLGDIYVADTKNALIRKITPAGVVTTLAGSPSARGNQDGVGTAATFQSPVGIALDGNGFLYVADSYTHTIRKMNVQIIPAVTAVAAVPGTPATATTAMVPPKPAIAAAPAVPALTVTTLAGKALTPGDADGVGANARFNNPTGISSDSSSYLYVADTNNNTLRQISTVDVAPVYDSDAVTILTPAIPTGTVKTLAGSSGISGSYDGSGNFALFSGPTGVYASSSGPVYIADTGNNLIRVYSGNRVTTAAGIAGIAGYRDGAAYAALLDHPAAITLSSSLYVADTGNSSLRSINGSSIFGVILKDPSTTTTTTPTTTPASGSSYGGGSMDFWFVGCLSCLLIFSRRRHRYIA